MRHKKFILSHHLLAHILYEIFFSVVKANISLSYVCTIKSEIRTYFINSIGILVFIAIGMHRCVYNFVWYITDLKIKELIPAMS